MLSQFEATGKIICSLLSSLLIMEERRSGFKITLEPNNLATIQCGDLGQHTVPLKPFPEIYSELVWSVLYSLRGTDVRGSNLVYNKYYIARRAEGSGKILIPREILEKIPELYDESAASAVMYPRLENLTVESLTALCNNCIDIAEFILQPESYDLYLEPISPKDNYLACYRGKWNILSYRKDTKYALWRFGLATSVRNLQGIEIRVVPDIVRNMPTKILSYRFESDNKEHK